MTLGTIQRCVVLNFGSDVLLSGEPGGTSVARSVAVEGERIRTVDYRRKLRHLIQLLRQPLNRPPVS